MTSGQARRWRVDQIALVAAAVLAAMAVAASISRNLEKSSGSSASAVRPAGAIADPIAALEARTRENPRDGEAWSALASDYFEGDRFVEAGTAYDRALELAPDKARLWSSRGEARIMASEHDPMPAAAAADFERAIALDPRDPRARYFLAVKQDLAGDHKGAIDSWMALLADTSPGAVWEEDLRRTIEQVAAINHIQVAKRLAAVRQPTAMLSPAARAIPGPTAEDLVRAQSLRPEDQRAMAEGMVARLETRLRSQPADTEGWVMLMRSRKYLGEEEKALQALHEALATNPGKAGFLRQQAEMLGVR